MRQPNAGCFRGWTDDSEQIWQISSGFVAAGKLARAEWHLERGMCSDTGCVNRQVGGGVVCLRATPKGNQKECLFRIQDRSTRRFGSDTGMCHSPPL